jgi:hypothetical protein
MSEVKILNVEVVREYEAEYASLRAQLIEILERENEILKILSPVARLVQNQNLKNQLKLRG